MRGEVVVIGGGITGLAAAFELAVAGCRVTLFEARRLGAMASGVTLGGVRQSGRHPAELPLARAAVAIWRELEDLLEAPTGYRRTGNLRLARTPEEAEHIAAMVAEQRAAGLDIALLSDPVEIRGLAPLLAEGIVAASFCPGDGQAEPGLVLAAYAAAARRVGVALREGETVHGLEVRGGRIAGVHTGSGHVPADAVVVAAGIESNALLAPLGLAIPMTVPEVAGFRTRPVGRCLGPVLGVANAEIALRQQLDGCLRVTGAAGEGGDGRAGGPRLAGFSALLASFASLLEGAAEFVLAETWAGYLDQTPDALPVIEAVPGIDGLVLAFGFSGHGFALGPIAGRLVRDLIVAGRSRLPLDAFRRDRFGRGGSGAAVTLHG